jgi:hypothetical protein
MKDYILVEYSETKRPFSRVTLQTLYEFCELQEIQIKRFRQLTSTWNSKIALLFSWTTSKIFPKTYRVQNKWISGVES